MNWEWSLQKLSKINTPVGKALGEPEKISGKIGGNKRNKRTSTEISAQIIDSGQDLEFLGGGKKGYHKILLPMINKNKIG